MTNSISSDPSATRMSADGMTDIFSRDTPVPLSKLPSKAVEDNRAGNRLEAQDQRQATAFMVSYTSDIK